MHGRQTWGCGGYRYHHITAGAKIGRCAACMCCAAIDVCMQDICYLLLCLLLPPIGVWYVVRAEYKHRGMAVPDSDHRVLASVCFTLMFLIPGMLFGLMVFLGVFRGSDTDLNINSPSNNGGGGSS